MSQKINPTNYRSFHNFEDSVFLQQPYGLSFAPYVFHEHLAISEYIKGFFKNVGLRLHSFKYVKTYKGFVYLLIKYIPLSERLKKSSFISKSKTFRFSTLEKDFIYGLSNFVAKTPVTVSFFNLAKAPLSLNTALFTNTNKFFFSAPELNAYLKTLFTTKGGAFFLATILSRKLFFMRSRVDRKSQKRFLLFVKLFLSYILLGNLIRIKGLRVSVKGRINGAPRSTLWVVSEGKISLQCIDAKIDYQSLPSETVFGTFGVKVWINYGE
jgi:hypothetical protein